MAAHMKQPITLPEYERIFRTIHGVLLNEESTPEKACLYFALVGAFLLEKHHRKTATFRAGAAAYNLRTPTNAVLVLGTIEDGLLVSTESAFHCWIEVDDWVIDLAAPLFNDMIDPDRAGQLIKPHMFQKRPSTLGSLDELNTPGTFHHMPNPAIQDSLMRHFRSMQANADLANICVEWYRPPPKKVPSFIEIANQHGSQSRASHSPVRVTGAW